MPIPTISDLPVPPSRSDATNFASRADAFLGALPTFQSEMNAAGAAINAVFFQPVFRNAIINGDFSVWQRATSQTSNGYGSDDRWINSHAGSTKTVSQQAFTLGQTVVPGEPRFFSRTVVTSAAGAGNFVVKEQRIEGVRRFAGRNVRLSFYAKADANRPIAVDFVQRFGSFGGSAEVMGIGAQKFNLTTSWQRFTATVAIPSIAGKTIGIGNDDHVSITVWFDAGSAYNARAATLGQQSGTFDLALVQVEEGTVDTAFEAPPPGVTLALCQRYGRILPDPPLRGAFASTTTVSRMGVSLGTPMRAAPAATIIGFLSLFDGSTTGTITALGTQYNTPTSLELDAVVATGTFTVGRPALVFNNGGGGLWLSAEL